MQFYDLACLEMRGRLPGEFHHEHRAHGEIRSDQHRGAVLRAGFVDLGQIDGGETGGTYNDRHSGLHAGEYVPEDHRRNGEVDNDVDPALAQRDVQAGEAVDLIQGKSGRHDRGPGDLPDTFQPRIDDGDQAKVVVGGHGGTGGAAHASQSPGHRYPQEIHFDRPRQFVSPARQSAGTTSVNALSSEPMPTTDR